MCFKTLFRSAKVQEWGEGSPKVTYGYLARELNLSRVRLFSLPVDCVYGVVELYSETVLGQSLVDLVLLKLVSKVGKYLGVGLCFVLQSKTLGLVRPLVCIGEVCPEDKDSGLGAIQLNSRTFDMSFKVMQALGTIASQSLCLFGLSELQLQEVSSLLKLRDFLLQI